ncbi:MAG: hypothetical protein V4654_13330 [Bdellovibrionota bacterium]
MKLEIFGISVLAVLLLPGDLFASCGLTGDINQRILDCSKNPLASVGDFKLVAETVNGNKVYLQKKNGLLWADRAEKLTRSEAGAACSSGAIAAMAGISGYSWSLPTLNQYQEAIAYDYTKIFSFRDGDGGLWAEPSLFSAKLVWWPRSDELPWFQQRIGSYNVVFDSSYPSPFQCVANIYPDCGQMGTVSQRIKNCSQTPESNRNSAVLVARQNGDAIYLDLTTGLMWSDLNKRDVSYDAGIKAYWLNPTLEEFYSAERSGTLLSLPSSSFIYHSSTLYRTQDYDKYYYYYRPHEEPRDYVDSEGYFIPNSPKIRRVATPPKEACGNVGSLKERIADCADKSFKRHNSFVLVSRFLGSNGGFKETYLDRSKGLLWSDTVRGRYEDRSPSYECESNINKVTSLTGLTWRLPTLAELIEVSQKGYADFHQAAESNWKLDEYYWSSTLDYSPKYPTTGKRWAYDFKNESASLPRFGFVKCVTSVSF